MRMCASWLCPFKSAIITGYSFWISVWEKTRSGKSHDYRDGNVFEKLRFCDGLVWRVSLTVEIKLRFRVGLVWTVGLTVEIKLRFRDELVWTVSITVEMELRFRDGLVWRVGLTVEIKFRFQISP